MWFARGFKDLDREVERVMDRALDKCSSKQVYDLVDVEIRDETELSSGPGMAIVLWEARASRHRSCVHRPQGWTLTLTELIESAVGDDLKGLLGAIEKVPDRFKNVFRGSRRPSRS